MSVNFCLYCATVENVELSPAILGSLVKPIFEGLDRDNVRGLPAAVGKFGGVGGHLGKLQRNYRVQLFLYPVSSASHSWQATDLVANYSACENACSPGLFRH
jgi:hypothetical protein